MNISHVFAVGNNGVWANLASRVASSVQVTAMGFFHGAIFTIVPTEMRLSGR